MVRVREVLLVTLKGVIVLGKNGHHRPTMRASRT